MQESDFKIQRIFLIKTQKEKFHEIQELNSSHGPQNCTLIWKKGGVNALNFGSIWCLASTVHLNFGSECGVVHIYIEGLKRWLTDHTVVWLPYCLCIDHEYNDIRDLIFHWTMHWSEEGDHLGFWCASVGLWVPGCAQWNMVRGLSSQESLYFSHLFVWVT